MAAELITERNGGFFHHRTRLFHEAAPFPVTFHFMNCIPYKSRPTTWSGVDRELL